ncbi:MAG: tetratricopeptide repeat protein [Acetobacteraceae bacterium]
MNANLALLQTALCRHREGDFRGAEELYRTVLHRSPDDADALHLLGLIAHRRGRHQEALQGIGEAVALRPEVALYRANLARAEAAAGLLEEAERSVRTAIALEAGNAEFHYDLGVVLVRLGRFAEADPCLRNAIALDPTHARAHNNLASVAETLGHPEEAEFHFHEAIGLEPGLAEAHANLGALLSRLGRPVEAEAALRHALSLAPDFPEALNTLGTVLAARRDAAGAEASFRRAIALDPLYPAARNNLAVLLTDQGRFALALAESGEVLQQKPFDVAAETNCGNALAALGRCAEAEGHYRRALQIAPDEAEIHYNLGLALLLDGRFREGWAEYEWRSRRRGARTRSLPAPLWSGEPLGGRVLLVHAEQGFGDTIQFCRFIPLLGGDRVVLEVPRPLARLVASLPGIESVIASGDPLPPFDLHCPMLSLPHRIGTTLETIPRSVPYLFAAPGSAAIWHRRLGGARKLKIGLAWAGNPEYPADRRRSIEPTLLKALLETQGASFISLQPGAPPAGMSVLAFPDEIRDFADTAALIAALDLVISVDTAAVHLAGALGKPVWLLNRFDTCWRWLRERTDSPWYPTLRQFRQSQPGDWRGVMEAVEAALARVIDDRGELAS